ncbi:uncharacterized protein JN550_000256 [Neoarthrinium moseri]|uniref:uncharacterized protein n=1 Tax=Neoarthrinium moseri TaxID=1658444 RepID=UPI001FDDC0B2|nr:uncharacterized protein JN550_000256 [Neoarthrinium moseri]KAI1878074.1 hypothetical protein JN550_000256 [Neoarthrinium moseri]
MESHRRHPAWLGWMFSALYATGVHGAVRGQWSGRTLGPDGPWNALEVTLGTDQSVTVYGGKMWESYFLGNNYCKATTTGSQRCYAAEKGAIYNERQGTGSSMGISFSPPDFWSSSVTTNGSEAMRWADDLYISDDTSRWGVGVISNVSMAVLSDTQLVYPNGKSYPLFAGCMSFGAGPRGINQTFQVSAGTLAGAKNVSLVAGQLASHSKIDSNSFGMHMGTGATPAVPGSLWYGGYDQNRVLGEVLAVPIQPDYLKYSAELSDISITTLAGDSPFSFTSKTGLLSSGNTTIGSSLEVGIEACVPYLNLPKSTCDAVASNLPVTYDAGLGLYMWNTGSSDYKRIVTSAAALTFSFPDPDNNARTVNISVPFRHLNLTLEEPLVSTPTPYFPCNGASTGSYSLGRAFLQDAFFGTNFENAVMYLAQGPGPNAKTENIVSIHGNDTVAASHNDLVKSWDGFWALHGETNATSLNGTSSSGTEDSGSGTTESSSKTPLIAGLAAGLGGGVVLIAFAALFFLRRRKRQEAEKPVEQQQYYHEQPLSSPAPPPAAQPMSYYDPKYQQQAPMELPTEVNAAELSGYPTAELPSDPQQYYQHHTPDQYNNAQQVPHTAYNSQQGHEHYSHGTLSSAEPTYNSATSTYVSGQSEAQRQGARHGPGSW